MSDVKSIEDHKTYGDAVIDRLTPAPPALKSVVKGFADAHKAYAAAAKVGDAARKVRDEALAAIGAKDDVQDATVDDLADELVGAKMGKRSNPFSTFTKYTPDHLKKLAYKTEAKEIGALVKGIAAAAPPAKVKSALTACTKAAGGVLAAIDALTKPQLAYDKALAARDALLPGWTLSLTRLKRHAAALWVEDVATYRATFAVPEKVAAPKRTSKKAQAKRAAKRAATKAATKAASNAAANAGRNGAKDAPKAAVAEMGGSPGAG